MKFIGTIMDEKYEVSGDNYIQGRLAVAEEYIKVHNLGDVKKTNLIGLVSLRTKKQEEKSKTIMEIVKRGRPPITIPGGKY